MPPIKKIIAFSVGIIIVVVLVIIILYLLIQRKRLLKLKSNQTGNVLDTNVRLTNVQSEDTNEQKMMSSVQKPPRTNIHSKEPGIKTPQDQIPDVGLATQNRPPPNSPNRVRRAKLTLGHGGKGLPSTE